MLESESKATCALDSATEGAFMFTDHTDTVCSDAVICGRCHSSVKLYSLKKAV